MKIDRPEKLSIVVFTGEFDKIHYALVMASAAAAIDIPVTLFFTMAASRALLVNPSWRNLPAGEIGQKNEIAADVDAGFKKRTVGDFEELLQACTSLGVKFMVCEMGLRAMDLEGAPLRKDIPITTGGIVTLLSEAKAHGQIIFV
jgi:peroxiredoxin family protein